MKAEIGRRLTPGIGYLEALTKENVELVTDSIAEITEDGILTADGKHRMFDAIIMATGFDVSFKPRWSQIGRNGRSLADEWSDEPKGYFSLAVSGHPNYFIFCGPAGPIGHGSLTSAIDWIAEYILKWVVKMAKEDIKYEGPSLYRHYQYLIKWQDIRRERRSTR